DLFIDTGILQFFSIGDPKIMQLIQKLGGKQTKIIERNNHSQSTNKQWGSIVQANIGESNSNSVMEVQTDLIHLNEIRELPRDEQYVFIDGLRPIHCKKLKYYTDPFFKNYDNNPLESRGCK
ncbi:MAG: type IV secretory system conjugative DNA transfer family protein, partial [Lentisphaerota bacterium]